jgi:YaaC-like protein
MHLFGLDGEHDRLRIRALRATPPALASAYPERREVFCAALGQFDELLTAAAAVGPASSPLPLYYALNQAGRAITAARQMADRPWKPRWHGLTIGDPEAGSLQQTPIGPQRHEDSSFRLLAEAIGADGLTQQTHLANVWAAIPNLPRPGLGAGCPRALPLEVVHSTPESAALRRLEGLAPTARAGEVLGRHIQETYPRAADGLHINSVVPEAAPFEGSRAVISWRHPAGTRPGFYGASSGYLAGYYLIPGVNKAGDVLEPILLWWCLLHALSSLARYHSAEWTAALNPDSSQWAVPVEQVLSMALEIVPRLVLNALSPGTEDDPDERSGASCRRSGHSTRAVART